MMPRVGWGKLHQPVEEDTQVFGGREETAVKEVELVVIFHQELKPSFVAAWGAHRLRGWERRHVGGKRGEETGRKCQIYRAAHAGQPRGEKLHLSY